MRIFSLLGYILVAILFVVWDLSIRSFLPLLQAMEPLLGTVVILALLQKRQASWLIAIISALVFDIFRLGSVPWFTLFMCVYLLFVQLIVTRVLANRSFYSAFFLLVIGRLIGFMWFWFSHESFALWPMPYGMHSFWSTLFLQLFLDGIWILLWYFIVSYWARRGPARYAQPTWFA